MATKTDHGKLWWTADNQQEANQWKEDLLTKGCQTVEFKPESQSERVHVIITLDRTRANTILGYEVEDEEWLIQDEA